jgi:predicted RNase H-like nuclease
MTLVVGMDACKSGWVAVALARATFVHAREFTRADEALAAWPELEALGIDIPIGLPDRAVPYPRQADVLAASFLGRRRSSVFRTPPLDVLEAPTYLEAVTRMRRQFPVGLSRQSYALRRKVLEVNQLARCEPRIYEVHPEVSFRAMAGDTTESLDSKRTWNGLMQRRGLLAREGIQIPDDLAGVPSAAPDDVLDAAAAAWSAWRIATGSARSLPDPPEAGMTIRRIAIHY